ncbi:hypothetical protein ACHAXT_003716 [Thalassiosira profunda]
MVACWRLPVAALGRQFSPGELAACANGEPLKSSALASVLATEPPSFGSADAVMREARAMSMLSAKSSMISIDSR